MTAMTKQEAGEKKALLTPVKNFCLIEFGYSHKLVLPYENGLKMMAAMQSAEEFHNNYDSATEIRPINMKDAIVMKPMSEKNYLTYKMNALLGVDTEAECP